MYALYHALSSITYDTVCKSEMCIIFYVYMADLRTLLSMNWI